MLKLPPLPCPLLTDWVVINDSQYCRPQFSGEYDLLVGNRVERMHYDAEHDTWRCIGGRAIWDWASAWRGSRIPFAIEG